MRKNERVYGMSDIAKALNISAQAIDQWHRNKSDRLLEPDWIGPGGTPFWSEASFHSIVETNRPIVARNKARGKVPSDSTSSVV